MPQTSPEAMLAAALKLAEKWCIFPAPPGTKKSYKSAAHSDGRKWGKTRDASEIRGDWSRWTEANVGIPTGKENGFWVLETDTRAGGHAHDGEETLAALVAQHGPLPDTLRARSPSGSVHYYFKWPEGDGYAIKNTAGKVGPGIDTRGEGGMVIAPPSNRGDGCYEWLNDNEVLEAPPWLEGLAIQATRREAATREAHDTHVDLDRLAAAIAALPNPLPEDEEVQREMGLQGGWEDWNKVMMAIYAATGGTSQGLKFAKDWSKKNEAKYDEHNTEEKWFKLRSAPPTGIGAGWLFKLMWKINPSWDRIKREDFYSHLQAATYLFVPLMTFWPKESVNAQLGPQKIERPPGEDPKWVKANVWLDQNRRVQQITWQPGMPTIIENKLYTREGIWQSHRGARAYNLYKAPTLVAGDARLAGPFLDVVDKVVGPNRPHVLAYFAHRVQRPWEKINHCLVIGGAPGIGKDSMIEPLRRAVGPNNFAEVDPPRMIGRFNRFLQAVVLRVNEARDLGEVNRYQFYEHLKLYTASPPDYLNIEEKYLPTYTIANVVGLIITTNYKDGLFLPNDDRRTHVSWSDANAEDIGEDFFTEYWNWLNGGGDAHVLAFLRDYDLSEFNSKAPPPKTAAFYETVAANAPPETNEVANVIEVMMGSPAAFNLLAFFNKIPLTSDFRDWAQKNKRVLGRRFAEVGYVSLAKPGTGDGFWRIKKSRHVIYVKASLTPREQVVAARQFVKEAEDEIDREPAGEETRSTVRH